MDTSVAYCSYQTLDPITKKKRNHRIELRRMKPEVKTDPQTGKATTYTHEVVSKGERVQRLTHNEMQNSLRNSQGGTAWDYVNPHYPNG